MKLLERHLYSTQAFIPMTCSKVRARIAYILRHIKYMLVLTLFSVMQRYLVVVALNDPKTDKPDLSTLAAFVAARNQGITYYPGVWHHPMIALDAVTGWIDNGCYFVC